MSKPSPQNLKLFIQFFGLTEPALCKIANIDIVVLKGMLVGSSRKKAHYEAISKAFIYP